MIVSHSTACEEPFNEDESHDCRDEDECSNIWIDFLTFKSLRKNMNHGVSNQCPAAKGIQQTSDDLEGLLADTAL